VHPPRRRGRAAGGFALTDEQPPVQHRLAGIRRALDACQPGDRHGRAACLVGCEAAELDRRDDAVAGRPCALAAFDARFVVGHDEAFVIARQTLDRGSEDARHREDTLHRESLAARLEHQIVVFLARHDAGLEPYARRAQLVGDGGARRLAEQRQRRVLGRHDRHHEVVPRHRAGLAERHQRELVGRQRPDRPGRHDDRERLRIALLYIAQQQAVGVGVTTGPPGRGSLHAADGVAAGRDYKRVERARAAIGEPQLARRVVDADDGRLHELGAGVLREAAQRHPVRTPERERLRDRHRPVREVRVGGDQRDAHTVARHCVQAE